MICVSLAEATVGECLAALQGLPFAEIRMDLMRLSPEDARTLFGHHKNLIATCRPGGLSDEERKELLLAAIDSGAAYVDVEVDARTEYRAEIVARARSRGCRVIVSFHDHEKTPGRPELEELVSECFRAGADIAKIACAVHSKRENGRLLGLLDDERKIVVVGMGEKGRITRIAATLLGSPFTFASLSKGRETAAGQVDRETLKGVLEMLQMEKRAEAGS